MRLLDWYRHLSNQAERVKNKRLLDSENPQTESAAHEKKEKRLPSSTSEPRPMIASPPQEARLAPEAATATISETPSTEALSSVPQPVEMSDVSDIATRTETAVAVQPEDRSAPQFDEIEMPEFESFLSTRRKTETAPPREPATGPALLRVSLSSSSGPVRPITPAAPPGSEPSVERYGEPDEKETRAHPVAVQAEPEHGSQPAPSEVAKTAQQLESGIPKHFQVLASIQAREVAQHSYKKSFKESRQELLQRLIDPPLALEEVARLLNVCPTTVRRYTNRGLLKHYRTIGNQRRFRLSDVVEFMESQQAQARSRKVQEESRQNGNKIQSFQGS